MKKFERKDDSKLHLYIGFCWVLRSTKKATNNTKIIFLGHFQALVTPGKKNFYYHIFFKEKPNFSKSLTLCSDKKRCSRDHCQTVIYSELFDQQTWLSYKFYVLKKSVKVSFVTHGIEKMGKKGTEYLFRLLHFFLNCLVSFQTCRKSRFVLN